MPWEDRHGHKYYYRAKNIRGQKKREYLGRGPAAELASAADDLRRLDREVRVRQQREEQTRREEAEAPLRQLVQATDLLVRASLLVAGFYQHDRGEWRHREHEVPEQV